ncbi:hypothetical protein RRF57_007959 [Xylaria bambusicola]|uniref:Dystroglycan-type cadherin-like domain-containing protein n=1 Tax=Xylaria bambusicola TaxID=326684 RepID=A0AAN7UGZ2_9PEZI
MTRRRASPRRGGMVITDSRRHLHSFSPGQLAILLFSIITPILGTPISYFPLNSQLPPVARVSEPFSFVFSPLTFSSDADEMSYALADGSPSWLSLDSASRTLSGTPDEATIPSGETLVGIVITLIASDDTGSLDANATLVVSRSPEPTVRIPLMDQIKKFGPYSAPSSILLHPSSEFEFEFDPNTFGPGIAKIRDGQGDGNGGKGNIQDVERDVDGTMSGTELPQLSYYAVSGNNAPLPSWVAFDPKKLAFSGKTPLSAAIAQPPQKFDFQLVASDVVGFSSAAIEFSIVLGNHELTSKEPIIMLNATKGKQFEYTDLPSILQLDEKPLKAEDVSYIKADGLPPWLSFNEESWRISGTPDMEAQPTNITIAVVDNFLDALNVTLAIEFKEKIFVSDLPGLNVSAGDDFSLDLQKFLFTPTDTQLAAKIQPDDSWIRFDESSMILSGTVPKPPDAKLADDIHISFDAIQMHTKAKETKNMIIYVNKSAVTPSPTPESPPIEAPTKEYDSRRDLYWLLIIPALVIAVAIILWIFMVRKRRNQPKKLDFSEVSGPVPGTFVANGYMDPSLDEVRRMVDTGPQAPYVGPYSPPGASNLKKSLSKTKSKIQVDPVTPHAMTRNLRTIKPVHQGNGNGESWMGGRPSRPSPVGTDEVSLLSSNSSRSRAIYDARNLFVKKRRPGDSASKKNIGLEVPEVPEPFSIQPTPDLAYKIAGKYDYVSDEDTQPSVGSAERQRLGHQKNASLSLQGAGNRLSQAWKRISVTKVGDEKRNSQHSASTDATTCTSILTSGVTEEATTASANVVAKPTIIHIGGRPGETRQLSRRTGGSTTFFAGGSITKSQRNFGLDKDTMSGSVYSSATSKEQGVARDTKSTWDHQTTSPLGISYRNVIPQKRGDTWNTDITNEELLSPSRWPELGVTPGQAITSDVIRDQNKPAQLPPFKLPNKAESPGTPMGKGKKRSSPMRRLSRIRGSISSLSQTPPTHTRSKGRSSREERLRLSRIREQKALDEFRVMMSHTPSPHNEWAPSRIRPLPETPSRTSKPPLAVDHANEPRGLKSTASKRSVKTLRSNKSVRSTRAYDDDDEDAWEDIPPPESVILGWEGDGSDGSFPVYI